MSLAGNISNLARLPSASSEGYGNVDGPASATANAVARFNGTTGKIIKNSAVTIDDSGAITAASLSTGSGAISGGAISGTTGTFSGTLGATGDIASRAIQVTGAYGGGLAANSVRMENSGGDLRILATGPNNATAGTLYITYSSANASVLGNAATFSSTGLAVTGNITGTGVYSTTTASAANVFVDSNGLLQRSTSSLRYKDNVLDYTRGIADVMALRPVWFTPKGGTKQHAGLIAEEVDAAGLKEFVEYDSEGRPDAIGYGHMVSLAFAGLQDHERELKSLRARVAALEAKLEAK